MKRLTDNTSSILSKLKSIRVSNIPFSFKWVVRILVALLTIIAVLGVLSYFLFARPLLNIAEGAKELRFSSSQISNGVKDLDFDKVKEGLVATEAELKEFKQLYIENTVLLRKFAITREYYEDSQRILTVAEQSLELGELIVSILEPHAADIGFSTKNVKADLLPAQDRIINLVRLMPEFSTKVSEISDRMTSIDKELSAIDASKYPRKLPSILEMFGVSSDIDIRGQILAAQAISSELSDKAPQFEAMFNALPEFMGVNEPKRYAILMHNNYELRMSGGFNTFIVVAEFKDGIPEIIDSIDTYFIDEGDRTGSSFLVNRNVPYFLRNYLYLSGNTYRLYARDATSVSPNFPTAADKLLTEFWYRDRTLPQGLNGVIAINNDVAVDILRVVGAVSTQGYSIRTDQGNYISVPVTEFNADNVIFELENIAGGRLAQTIGRKKIIEFLAEAILNKIFTSEATNLLNIAQVALDSMSKKDVLLYSFSPQVQKAFEDLGYGGRIEQEPVGSDYLHVNRSNFGAGKADWTGKEGFITQTVEKSVEVKGGKAIGTVSVTVHNPKRPDWYNIDPCCFYNAYMRVYVPAGSTLISAVASDGQEVNSAEFQDTDLNKTFFETFTRQLKETDLTITYTYELPGNVDFDNYNLFIQRQPGTSIDPYTISLNGVSQEILLNSDKNIRFE